MAQKGTIWNEIEKDDYVAYDALLKVVKDAIAGSDNEMALRVEDVFNDEFVKLMDRLEREF